MKRPAAPIALCTAVFAATLFTSGCRSVQDSKSESPAPAPAPGSLSHTTAFIHPGILHNRAELEFVRAQVKTGKEPWQSAWTALRATPQAALTWKPKPNAKVFRGPYNNPDRGAGELSDDALAAYTHAIEWSITQNPAHADKAIEILNAYARTLQAIEGHDAPLLVGMSGFLFLNAAEIVRHTSDQWSATDQKKFAAFVRELLYPIIKNFTPGYNGNWDAAEIQTMLAMGVFLDDHALFNRALDQCLRGQSNGSIRNYINEFGECQESGRDQAHTQMGLGYLGCACEVAWKQRVDLYATADNRLASGFEYTAKYNLGNDVPFVPFHSVIGRNFYATLSPERRGTFSPIYEKVYRHYHDRLGLDMPFTRQVLEKIRPETGSLRAHTQWGTLMFCKVPPKLAPGKRAAHTGSERPGRGDFN